MILCTSKALDVCCRSRKYPWKEARAGPSGGWVVAAEPYQAVHDAGPTRGGMMIEKWSRKSTDRVNGIRPALCRPDSGGCSGVWSREEKVDRTGRMGDADDDASGRSLVWQCRV
jgi:hypothetical protein